MFKIFKNFKWFKECSHNNVRTVTNIYGDAINYDARSIRICEDCGKIIYSDYLDQECHKINNFSYSKKKYKGERHDTL